ncbi:MAG: EamA-like transporter family [Solidesulfovibrio magneticus str. Maddingley MBC34]|uniref:EamA-like transporter family n=1 Tax=Solidesulfovibrio magneticus str. Maddingley MBC34 TaxID=1206767 RepID=K6HE96_9BACT|nr:MAG: EamA-like transporter family [Solidesulfovibrio magneticus str. Maddingley MBC34]
MGQLLFGAVIISFSAVFVKLAGVPSAVSAFYRMFFGGLTLLGLLGVTGNLAAARRALAWPAFACAVFFSADLFCWHLSINYIGPGLATLVGNFQVFLVTVVAAVTARRVPKAGFLAGMAVAVAGLYLVVGRGFAGQTPEFRLGVGYGLATALFYGLFILTLKKAVTDQGRAGPMAAMAVLSLAGAALLAPVAVLGGDSLALPTATSVWSLVALGVIGQGIGWLAISQGLAGARPALAGLVLLLQPTLSYVWDVLFFGKPTGPVELAGVALALAGIYVGSTQRS